jgi:hypothetical protein
VRQPLTNSDFARALPNRLTGPSAAHLNPAALAAEIYAILPSVPRRPPADKSAVLDQAGTELYNLATRLARSAAADHKAMLCAVHVFSAYLLDAAMRGRIKPAAAGGNGASRLTNPGEGGDWEKAARVLRVLVRTARQCAKVYGVEPSVGGKVLERAAECVVLMEGSGDTTPEDAESMARLRTDYLAVRMLTVCRFSVDALLTYARHGSKINLT